MCALTIRSASQFRVILHPSFCSKLRSTKAETYARQLFTSCGNSPRFSKPTFGHTGFNLAHYAGSVCIPPHTCDRTSSLSVSPCPPPSGSVFFLLPGDLLGGRVYFQKRGRCHPGALRAAGLLHLPLRPGPVPRRQGGLSERKQIRFARIQFQGVKSEECG